MEATPERSGSTPPHGFKEWPPHVRRLWTELERSASWLEAGWVHASYRQLLARGVGSSEGSVKRAYEWLRARGWIDRVRIATGDELPNGARAWCDHWLTLAGPHERARRESTARSNAPICREIDPPADRSPPRARPRQDAQTAENTARRESPRPMTRDEPAPFKEVFSPIPEETNQSSKAAPRAPAAAATTKSEAPALSPERRTIAGRLLRHYALAAGLGVLHFRASSLAMVAASLDDMEGDDAVKERRVRAVIDDAIAESRRAGISPSLGFVFHPRHFRRRLHRLAESENTAHKEGPAEGDMFAAGFMAGLEAAEAALEKGDADKAAEILERAEEMRARVSDRALHRRFDALHTRLERAVHEVLAESLREVDRQPPITPPDAAPARPVDASGPRNPPIPRPERSTAPPQVASTAATLAALKALFDDSAPAPPANWRDGVIPPLPSAEEVLSRDELAAAQEAAARARARWGESRGAPELHAPLEQKDPERVQVLFDRRGQCVVARRAKRFDYAGRRR